MNIRLTIRRNVSDPSYPREVDTPISEIRCMWRCRDGKKKDEVVSGIFPERGGY